MKPETSICSAHQVPQPGCPQCESGLRLWNKSLGELLAETFQRGKREGLREKAKAAGVDKHVDSLREVLGQYNRAMNELGWTMLNVQAEDSLDAVVDALSPDKRPRATGF